jgi:hypothetical protein
MHKDYCLEGLGVVCAEVSYLTLFSDERVVH